MCTGEIIKSDTIHVSDLCGVTDCMWVKWLTFCNVLQTIFRVHTRKWFCRTRHPHTLVCSQPASASTKHHTHRPRRQSSAILGQAVHMSLKMDNHLTHWAVCVWAYVSIAVKCFLLDWHWGNKKVPHSLIHFQWVILAGTNRRLD